MRFKLVESSFLKDWENMFNGDLNKTLAYQDMFLELCKKNEAKYRQTGDIDTYITFWEDVWWNCSKQYGTPQGLPFNGSRWTFELYNYMFEKRYDDALNFLQLICKIRPNYRNHAEDLINKTLLKMKKISPTKLTEANIKSIQMQENIQGMNNTL